MCKKVAADSSGSSKISQLTLGMFIWNISKCFSGKYDGWQWHFFATLITFKSQQADDVAGNFEEEF